MPKVLRIINRLNLGGPTYNVAYLTKYLAPRYETMLLAGMHDETEAGSEFILDELDVKPQYIGKMYRSVNPVNDLRSFLSIKEIIKKFKPDIVHTHAAKAGALGRLAAYQCGVPVIVHTFHGHVFHSYFHPVKTKIFISIEKYLASISTGIIAISNLQKKELSDVFKICGTDKIKVIPLGFDLERFQKDSGLKRKIFREKYRLQEDEIAIGIIGRLVPVKNHTLFLKSLKKVLTATTKKIKAFIIGDGEEMQKIKDLAQALELPFDTTDEFYGRPLVFTSWIKNIDEAMAGLDIIALTSFNEGTPVSLIEAQASNKPIVSTAVGGIEDVVKENETALLAPSNNADVFAEKLLMLVENNELQKRLGSNGFEFVNEHFSFRRLAADTAGYYNQLLEGKI